MTYDVRAIANYVLKEASRRHRSVTNLGINKIVFFLHAAFLQQRELPLVVAKIEAWQYGPVFRELYQAFKHCGEQPIRDLIRRIEPDSGYQIICEAEFDRETERFINEELTRLFMFSASDLVSWSHEKNGPWFKIWNHEGESNVSMRISDQAIREWFSHATRN